MYLAEKIHNYFKTGRELNADTGVSTIGVGMYYDEWIDEVAAELDIEYESCQNAIMELEAKASIFVIPLPDDGTFIVSVEVND